MVLAIVVLALAIPCGTGASTAWTIRGENDNFLRDAADADEYARVGATGMHLRSLAQRNEAAARVTEQTRVALAYGAAGLACVLGAFGLFAVSIAGRRRDREAIREALR